VGTGHRTRPGGTGAPTGCSGFLRFDAAAVACSGHIWVTLPTSEHCSERLVFLGYDELRRLMCAQEPVTRTGSSKQKKRQ